MSAAILASNAHNTQPWLFRLHGSRIDLFADESRDIGAIDPFAREKYISLGCALENLLLAAGAAGYDYDLKLMPDRENPDHAATIELSAGEREASPLYDAIPRRHTNRYAFDTGREVSRNMLGALRDLNSDEQVEVFWFDANSGRDRVGREIVRAVEAVTADEGQARDNNSWNRHGWDETQRHRDGLVLNVMGLSAPALAVAKMGPRPSDKSANDFWLSATKDKHVSTASAFGIIAVRDYGDNAQRMSAGRLWQRARLQATVRGIAMHPMNQLHERADRETQLGIEPTFGDALKGLVDHPEWEPLFTFRTGYPAEDAPPGPRRRIRDVLI